MKTTLVVGSKTEHYILLVRRYYMDYTSTNNWYGWMFYYLAHLIKCCGRDLPEAIICFYQSCTRALLYKQGLIPGADLSDNECIISSNIHWIPEFLTTGINQEALDWWLAHV